MNPLVDISLRRANLDDVAVLAALNTQLIQDEGHRNRMTLLQLEQRMRGWLASEYAAVLFENEGEIVAYALYRESSDEIHLRQFFVKRDRRRQGIGRTAFAKLRSEVWPPDKRLTVDVLVHNVAAIAFWRAVGCQEYSLTLEILPETQR